MAEKKIKVKITAAVVVGGGIARPGDVVEIGENLAKKLLQNGRAELLKGKSKDTARNYSKMKVAELKAIADEMEIDGFANMNQSDLVAAIEAAESA